MRKPAMKIPTLKIRALLIPMVLALAASSLACNSRTDESESGVVLTIAAFDELPVRASVNLVDFVQVGELTLENRPANPTAPTSNLQDIELRSYEVTFTRADRGTRVPPAKVAGIFGNVPVNGEDRIVDLPILTRDQMRNPPLSDLLFVNGGLDAETRSNTILLNCRIRFFGRTISGDNVASNTATFLMEFVP